MKPKLALWIIFATLAVGWYMLDPAAHAPPASGQPDKAQNTDERTAANLTPLEKPRRY